MTELVTPEIKSIYAHRLANGPEQGDPAQWQPEDPETFALPLMIFIGSTDSPNSDSFDATVCSPQWVAKNFYRLQRWDLGDDVVAGRRLLLMDRWDYEKFRAALETFVAKCTGPTWGDVANRIGRVLPWEFAYQYDDRQDRAPRGVVE